MIEVDIKNEELLEILDEMKWFYDNKEQLSDVDPSCPNDKAEDFISQEYKEKIIKMGSSHNGLPDSLYGYNLRDYNSAMFHKDSKNKTIPKDFVEKYNDINERLMTVLSVKHNAVATMYPPGGFISWHNNANATGFNLIFTWSETGDGYFDYIDEDGKEIRLHDKKGKWVCRYGMFGRYFQTEHPIVYHSAYTDCWRFTVAYVFNAQEASSNLQQFIIDEITNP